MFCFPLLAGGLSLGLLLQMLVNDSRLTLYQVAFTLLNFLALYNGQLSIPLIVNRKDGSTYWYRMWSNFKNPARNTRTTKEPKMRLKEDHVNTQVKGIICIGEGWSDNLPILRTKLQITKPTHCEIIVLTPQGKKKLAEKKRVCKVSSNVIL